MTRLAVRVFFGLLAATACVGEQRTATSDSSGLSDSIAFAEESPECAYLELEWECNIGPGMRVKVAMVLDPADTTGSNPLKELTILPVRGGVRPHSLRVGDTMGAIDGSELTVSDLDGDGFRDLLLEMPYGHPNNSARRIWRYQAAARRFLVDSVLSEGTNVSGDDKGCVRTLAYLGMSHQTDSRLCLQGGRWVEVSRHEQRNDDSTEAMWEYFFERRGDSLALVKKQPMEP